MNHASSPPLTTSRITTSPTKEMTYLPNSPFHQLLGGASFMEICLRQPRSGNAHASGNLIRNSVWRRWRMERQAQAKSWSGQAASLIDRINTDSEFGARLLMLLWQLSHHPKSVSDVSDIYVVSETRRRTQRPRLTIERPAAQYMQATL